MRGNKQGLGAISAPSVGLGVKGAIITFLWIHSGTGSGLMGAEPGKGKTNILIS